MTPAPGPTRSQFRRFACFPLLVAMGALACSSGDHAFESEINTLEQAVVSTKPVLVNQLGYATGATKIAVMPTSSTTTSTFKVVNASGTEVWNSGTTQTVFRAADTNSGQSVQVADFSAFQTAGTGYKVVIGANESESFDISNDLYGSAQLGKAAIKFFTWKRSGMAVTADPTFNIAGHLESHASDASLPAYGSWRSGSFDVKGGWYDAGDFGKYMESHTAATWYLANLWERLSSSTDPGGRTLAALDLGFTDGTLPDYVAELAWGTRWVRGAMPDPTTHKAAPAWTDLVANKCTSQSWAEWVNYHQDTAARYCMGPSTSSTTSAARSMAQVSRILKPYGTSTTIVRFAEDATNLTAGAYADKLWTAAKEAFGRATGKHADYADYTGAGKTGTALFTSDLRMSESPGFNQGSGAYGDEDMADDEYVAAVELYLTACQRDDALAVAKYKGIVTSHGYYKQAGPCDWGSESELGDPDGEEVGCGLLSILAAHDVHCTGSEALPAADIAAMKTNLNTYASSLVTNINGQNYPFYVAGGGAVPWGSNGAVAGSMVILTAAYEYSGNKDYLKAAARLGDYLLGTNPMKTSYVIGFGDAFEQYTHDRAMKATGGWVRGTLVGGPHNRDGSFAALASRWGGTNNIDDPATPDSGAPLVRYTPTDNGDNSWECKENAVNWNGSFANAIWGLQVHFDDMGTGGGGCTPATCASLGAGCGSAADGCGGTLSCGTCSAGETCNASNQCVSSGGGGAGSISFERWDGITGTSLTGFPPATAPSSTGTLSSFEAPSDAADNYGMRVRGYLTAPTTGSYTFWVAGDDNVDLYLGSNNSPSTKTRIAYHTGWTSSRQWDKYTSQKSAAVNLTAGQQYYIEALVKEGVGGDGLAVGWAKPGQATTAPSEVVPGSVLSPYSAPGCSSAADCNDGNVCTTDACTGGACTYTNNTASCTDDGNVCTIDVCSGGVCTHPAGNAGTTCRAAGSNATCDPAETCDGASTSCPANGYAASGLACNDGNASTSNDVCNGSGTCAGTASGSTPYGGTARSITSTIQAEDYDNGGQGVAFNDADAANTGGAYRTGAADGVDVQVTADTDGGYNVGWTAAGEWMKYTVDVATSGTYSLQVRVATPTPQTMHVEVDGVDKSGAIAVPNTGGWQTWQTVTVNNISLTAGSGRVVRVVFDTGSMNLNWFKFSAGGGGCTSNANCNDNNACTTDTCNTSTGVCSNTAITCNDGNSCTDDSCNTSTGCVYTADNTNTCTGGTCSGGTCVTGGGEPCTPQRTLTAGETNSSNFNTTGPFCFRTNYATINGWGCSNFDGRTLQVNDTAKSCGSMPLPTKYNGYYYFEATGGTFDYASIYWW